MPGVWGCFQSVYYFNNWNLEKYILYYTTRYNRNKIGILIGKLANKSTEHHVLSIVKSLYLFKISYTSL